MDGLVGNSLKIHELQQLALVEAVEIVGIDARFCVECYPVYRR